MKVASKTKADLIKANKDLGQRLKEAEEKLITYQKNEAAPLPSQKLARSILDQSIDAIIICDENGKIVQASQIAHRFFKEMVLGHPFDKVCRLAFTSALPFQSKEFSTFSVVAGKMFRSQEVTHRHDGQVSYFLLSARPLLDGKNILGCVVTLTDVTERKRMEERLPYLASFPEINPNPIIEVDLAGTSHYLNPAAKELFLGLENSGTQHPSLAGFESFASSLKEQVKGSLRREIKIGNLWYDQIFFRVPGMDCIRIYSRDISERKQMEEELRKSRDELEIRVQQRTAELMDVVEALQDEMSEGEQTERALQKVNDRLNERIKEINCLYSVCYHVGRQYPLLEEKFQKIVNQIPSGWQYPQVTCARIILEDKEYRTDNFQETVWKQASEITVQDKNIGTMEVFYLEERPTIDEGPFLTEERGLINTIAVELGEMVGRVKAEKALEEQSRILEGFFTSTITPLVFLDRDFNFIRVNEAYAKACQRDVSEFLGHNHFEFYPSDAKTKFEQVVQTKEPYAAIAKPFTFPDHPEWGTTYWDWTLTPILDDTGEAEFLVLSLEDVTKRKRAEEAVKAERQRFNDALEILPVYLVLLTPDYHVPFANRFFRERFGESHGQRCFEYLFGRSEPCEICETYTALKTMAPHEWEWTGPDGRNYDVFDFPFTDTDGSTLILEMGIDITERKRAEDALRESENRLRSLSSQLLTVQESERRRIARELHDGVGQMLTAVKFKVESVLQEKGEGKARARVKSLEPVIPMIRESMEEVRRIQTDLRPSVLDDLGVLAALSALCRNFEATYSHIHIERQTEIREEEVSTLLKTVIYRVSQEALNNIAKHSKADLARLSLKKIGDKIELKIEDNGMGFDPEQTLSLERARRGMGLDSMRERAELSGGTFAVKSTKGKGTTIKVSWPLELGIEKLGDLGIEELQEGFQDSKIPEFFNP